MAKFQFRLSTLLRLREAARDERRGRLADALKAADILRQRDDQLRDELSRLRTSAHENTEQGRLNIDRLVEAQRYEMVIEAERAANREHAAQLETEIENRRQALVIADRDVHVLEKLRETKQRQYHLEIQRQEAKQYDEIAAHATRREDVR